MLRGTGRRPPEKPPAISGSLAGVASLKRNKGEDAEAGKPEKGKSVVKESERFRGRPRECEAEKPGEEFNAVCAAIKEYDRYKSL